LSKTTTNRTPEKVHFRLFPTPYLSPYSYLNFTLQIMQNIVFRSTLDRMVQTASRHVHCFFVVVLCHYTGWCVVRRQPKHYCQKSERARGVHVQLCSVVTSPTVTTKASLNLWWYNIIQFPAATIWTGARKAMSLSSGGPYGLAYTRDAADASV
jgi:hypothetical protein